MDETLAFLQNCKTFFIGTVEGNEPKIRPFGFVMKYEDRLYFVTGNQKPFFKRIQENPNIEICGTNEKSEWIRLSGKVVIDSRMEVKKRAFEVTPELVYAYQTVDSPIFECFYLTDAEASFCSMMAPPRTVKF